MAEQDQIDIIIADLDLFTAGEIIALTLNIDANLREAVPLGTPVDTGWVRANWVPSVGEPYEDSGVVPEAVREAGGPDGDKSKLPQALQLIVAQSRIANQGLNEVLNWKIDGGPIFVTNNVPYIGALNNGHSKQSPRGFVQNAIEVAIRETYSSGADKATRLRRSSAARERVGKPGGTVASHAFVRARNRRNGK